MKDLTGYLIVFTIGFIFGFIVADGQGKIQQQEQQEWSELLEKLDYR